MKGEVVSRPRLASIFGVSLPTIDAFVRAGMPAAQRGGPGRHWAFNTASCTTWLRQHEREGAADVDAASEAELRRRRLAAQTRLVEIELAQAQSLVAPVAQMEQAMTAAFAEVRANLRTIPSRAVRQLIGETDELRFKKVLLAEIDQALLALSRAELITDADLAEPEHEEIDA